MIEYFMAQFKLRPYQRNAVEAGAQAFSDKKNGILVLPTGSGKSLVIANIVKSLEGNTIVLQPSKEILEQNMSKMISYGERNIGVYSASMNVKTIGKITFATIGSIVNKTELFKNFKQIIIDECHLVNSKGGMYEKFIKELNIPTIGLTATPFRLRTRNGFNGERLSESKILTRTRPRIFSKIFHITQIKELYDSGFLAPLEYITDENYNHGEIESNSTKAGFNEGSLKKYNARMNLNDSVIKRIMMSGADHRLIFNQFVDDSTVIEESLKLNRASAFQVSAKTKKKDRENILSAFKEKRIGNILNVGVLTVGFDFPELDEIIISRPTKSCALYYQMIGRGIRIAPNKKYCTLVDLCGNVKRFGKIETFEFVDVNGNEMWKLKSDAGFLTGVDVDTKEDLEHVKEKKVHKNGNEIVTFGKHNGEPVCKIPADYLQWCVDNFESGKWKKLFEKELKRRTSHD